MANAAPAQCPPNCCTADDVDDFADNVPARVCDLVVTSKFDLISSGTSKNFHVQDATGGITIFGSNAVIDAILPTIEVGSTVDIEGTTDFFNGLFELTDNAAVQVLTVTSNGIGPAPTPEVITCSQFVDASPVAEFYESRLVRLNCALINATGTFAANTNYTILDATGTVINGFRIISTSTTIVGQPIPTGEVDVIGILGQFDGTDPRDGGYQLMPRTISDIIANNVCPTPEVPPTATGALVIGYKNTTSSITLTGAAGNLPGANARFRIKSLPTLGTLNEGGPTINTVPFTLAGNTVNYVPILNATGLDGFNFDVWNGLAGANERFSVEATERVAIQNNTVFVSEFMANPSGGNDFDSANPQEEYIEIYNPTGSAVSLGHIGDATTPDFPISTNGNLEETGISIPANSAMIIAHSHAPAVTTTEDAFICCWGLTSQSAQVKFVHDVAGTGVPPTDWKGLNNAGDVIYLYDLNGGLLDAVAYRANTPPPFAGSWPPDNGFGSAALMNLGGGLNSTSNDNGANWAFHDPDGGLEDFLLFGMYNSCATGAANDLSIKHDRGSPLFVNNLAEPPTPEVPPTPQAGADSVVSPATFVDITLTSENGGGTLSYVIESQSTGQLNDPNGGVIGAVPYTLLANGDVVRYTAPPNASGTDSFLFSTIEDGAASCQQATISISFYTLPAGPDLCLIISEVVDGGRTGGSPKWVEITNTGSNAYTFPEGGLIVQANAASDVDVDVDLTGTVLAVNEKFVIASSLQNGQAIFLDTYGFDADLYSSAAFGNGDDRYLITNRDDGSNIIDIYGEFGVSGTGTAWEYTDGYSRRNAAFTSGEGVAFNAAQWTFGGVDSLEAGADDAAARTLLINNTFPNAHTFNGGCVSQGACCTGVNSCNITTQAGCTGSYQGDGTLCTPNPCGPTGACCTDNFGCVPDLTLEECTDIGGLDWNSGQDCTSCPQPPTGACCNFDGSCDDGVTSDECANTNGIYQGDKTTCEFTTCPGPSEDLLITEIADGDLPGGIPKWVELTNCGTTPVSMGLYSLANFNNGSVTPTNSYQLTGVLSAGASYIFEYDNPVGSRFEEVYGFASNQFSAPEGTTTEGRLINGDDAIALILGPAETGTIVDVYGEIGVDGTGAVWEYLDGYSHRNDGGSPSPTFVPAQWTFGGVDSLDGGDEAADIVALQTLTDPGAYVCAGVPAATITSALSRKTCDINLLPELKSDSRQAGITQIVLGFNTNLVPGSYAVTAGGPGGTGVTIQQQTCAAPGYVSYVGSLAGATASASGSTLTITIAAPGLANVRTYRLNMGTDITSAANQEIEVRGLIGDVNSDGRVNATDRSLVVGQWTAPGFSCATDAATDIDVNGATNATDRSLVVGAWTNPAANCAP